MKLDRKDWLLGVKQIKERPFSGDTNQIRVSGSLVEALTAGKKATFLHVFLWLYK